MPFYKKPYSKQQKVYYRRENERTVAERSSKTVRESIGTLPPPFYGRAAAFLAVYG